MAARDLVRRSLWERVPRDHREAPRQLRRRQLVTAAFLVAGGLVLGYSLRLTPGSTTFYWASLVLASVWTVGAFASGPLHLGAILTTDEKRSRPVLQPIVLGLALVVVFVVGGYLIKALPFLDPLTHQIQSVLELAQRGSLPILIVITAVNGIAEELFFRGAAYAATTRHPVPVTTIAYTIATLASGNVMLTFAAVLLGLVVGLERRASGGILAPILTHVTWSLSMLFLLPLIFLGSTT